MTKTMIVFFRKIKKWNVLFINLGIQTKFKINRRRFTYQKKILLSIHYLLCLRFFMPFQMTCASCSIITLVTGIFYPFMYNFDMLFQMTSCSSSIFTLTTRKFYFIMYITNMSPKSDRCSGYILTLITRISHSNVLIFNMCF